VIPFDRRGSGASDGVPVSAIPTIEEWTDDVLAVLDVTGSERAVIIGSVDASPVALQFAALHPERVAGLVLVNAAARFLRADDYPIGASPDDVDALIALLRASWGTIDFVRATNPGIEDPDFIEDTARWMRIASTPRAAAAQFDYILRNLDVRQALPLVQAPTRVLHVEGSAMVPIEHGRYLAEHIDGATFSALSGWTSPRSSASRTTRRDQDRYAAASFSFSDASRLRGRGQRAADQCLVVLDDTRQQTKVDDLAGRLLDDVDDLGNGWGVGITGDDDGAGRHERRVARFVQEGPDEAGLVFVVQVGGDVNGHHGATSVGLHGTGWPLASRGRSGVGGGPARHPTRAAA
jgi:hypothetical protein